MHLSQIDYIKKKYNSRCSDVKMVHKLNTSSNFISIHSAIKKMAAIPFLSLSFILSVVICIFRLLFLACHVNILYSVFVDLS